MGIKRLKPIKINKNEKQKPAELNFYKQTKLRAGS